MYKIDSAGKITRISDGASIPKDEDNRDYINYLGWLSEGNTPIKFDVNTSPSRSDIEAMRLRAYADPLTGSDRHFNEAIRMQAMGEPGWEAVRQRGILRFEEIQQQYPWPA